VSRLAETSLGDIVRGANRYRPVAITVGAIVAVVSLMPGKPELGAPLAEGGTESRALRPAATGGAAQAAAALESPGPTGAVELTGSTSFSSGAFSSDGGTFSFGDDSGSFSSSEFDSAPSFVPDDESEFGADAVPLTVSAKAWASQTSGTPVAGLGVPAGSLPVGNRLGRTDKTSFVRLTGTDTSLTLQLADASGQRSPESAAISACRITDRGWKEGEALSFSAAPKYDTNECLIGARNSDGTWTFNFLGYEDVTDDRGWALIPGPGAPVDFQVAFKPA
jgi:hypothetical protein